MVTAPASSSSDLTQQVQDALAHLYDPAYLQTHPLAQQLAREEPRILGARAGKALRQRFLDAIAALRPATKASEASSAWRPYRLLELRYIEALDPAAVQEQLGISKSQYYRDHARALKALISTLSWHRDADGKQTSWRAGATPLDRDSPQDAVALRIQLLGAFRLWVGPSFIADGAWRLRKAQRLLKLLALAPGHRLHREQVMDLFWPETDPDDAANNLRQVVHAARRALSPNAEPAAWCLPLESEWLALDPGGRLWVDVDAFEAAAIAARGGNDLQAYQAALALYTGDLLPEDRYDDKFTLRREELRQTYRNLLEDLAQLYQRRGHSQSAIAALQQVVRQDPACEPAHVGLMRLYALSGRRHEALRQHQQLQARLRSEFDVEPEPATQRLYDDILVGRFPPSTPCSSQPEPHYIERDVTEISTETATQPVPGMGPTAPEVQDDVARKPWQLGGTNLPAQLTRFIGREREMADVQRLLSTTRLVTLTGTGGCGKTRLAIEAAAGLLEHYPDGVWLVELAALTDPALVTQTLAASLGIREQRGREMISTLEDALGTKQLLLVLDNCEHLVTACATVADQLLCRCPRVQILATSREALSIAGETVYHVPTLSLPPAAAVADRESLERSDAVRLFVDRAIAAQPHFMLTSHSAPSVAEICRRLDGIPLAIELAAAMVRGLSAQELATRLDQRFQLLTIGSRTALPRHQTLRALVDWSYDRLTVPERLLFDRLAVFAGGFTLQGVEAVCSNEPGMVVSQRCQTLQAPSSSCSLPSEEVLGLLLRLVEQSLVVVVEEGPKGETRYRLLETLRQYAHERLQESGEGETIRARHAAHFLTVADGAKPHYGGLEHPVWSQRLEAEHDNLRAALTWLSEHDPAAGLLLATAVMSYWYIRGHATEGQERLERLLAIVQVPAAQRASILFALAQLAELQLDPMGRSCAEESLSLYREIGNWGGAAGALTMLGVFAIKGGDLRRARALFEESLSLAQQAGHTGEIARALRNLGLLTITEGDYERAQQLFEESLTVLPEVRSPVAALNSLGRLAVVARLQGDFGRAHALLEQGLALARATGHRHATGAFLASFGNLLRCKGDYHQARFVLKESLALQQDTGVPVVLFGTLACFGVLAVTQGAFVRGVRLIAAASAGDGMLGAPHAPEVEIDCRIALHEARIALDESEFAKAWTEGQAMTVEATISYALEEAPLLANRLQQDAVTA